MSESVAASGGAAGQPVASSSPVPPGAPVAAVSSSSPSATGDATPAAKGGGCGKVLLIAVVVLALLAALGIGGFAYLAYRAKKKVDEVRQAYKENNLEKMVGALDAKEAGGQEGKEVEAMPTYPVYAAGTAASVMPEMVSGGTGGNAGGEASMGNVVPMRAGLRITTAIQQSRGDYESIKSIRSVNQEGVRMEYSADVPELDNPFDKEQKKTGNPKTLSVHATRKILRADLESAHEYAQDFSPRLPVTLPSTTSLGVSAGVLNELKMQGESPFTYQATGLKGALGNLIGGLGGMTGGMGNAPGGPDKQAQDAMKDLQKMSKVSCMLKRVDYKIYSFPVLVNGERTQVPAVRATCKSDEGGDAEFYFLDDAQNPLSLTWKLGSSDRLQVIKLEYVSEQPGSGASASSKELEQKLENKEKVQIYGIYFDFASAKIKPVSKPTLDEIAGVMKAHPGWKLSVEGHTDNVGTDPANLELSKQRAAAVKDALVTEYRIATERLDTSGLGAARPVETNATMEGRARNRRVELSRE